MNIDLAPLDYLKEQHIHLCIVCRHGTLSKNTFHSFIKWQEVYTQMGISCTVDTVGDTAVEKNRLAREFLITPGTTHMLFIDANMAFEPWHILALLSSKKHVIGSNNSDHDDDMLVEGDIKEVSKLGGYFLMLSREALTHLQDKPFDEYQDICDRWRGIGGYVWAHEQVNLVRT